MKEMKISLLLSSFLLISRLLCQKTTHSLSKNVLSLPLLSSLHNHPKQPAHPKPLISAAQEKTRSWFTDYGY